MGHQGVNQMNQEEIVTQTIRKLGQSLAKWCVKGKVLVICSECAAFLSEDDVACANCDSTDTPLVGFILTDMAEHLEKIADLNLGEFILERK